MAAQGRVWPVMDVPQGCRSGPPAPAAPGAGRRGVVKSTQFLEEIYTIKRDRVGILVIRSSPGPGAAEYAAPQQCAQNRPRAGNAGGHGASTSARPLAR